MQTTSQLRDQVMHHTYAIEQVCKSRLAPPPRARKRAGRLERKQSLLRRSLQCERLEDRLAPSLNANLFQLDRNALQSVPAGALGDDWNNVLCPLAGCPSPT